MFRKSYRSLLVVVILLAMAGFAYAFAASNTVPDTKAGDGEGAISGYTITNVQYTLDATDPSTIASVSFDLDAAASSVSIMLDSSWYSCTPAGTSVTCTTTGATVLGATSLQVVAAN